MKFANKEDARMTLEILCEMRRESFLKHKHMRTDLDEDIQKAKDILGIKTYTMKYHIYMIISSTFLIMSLIISNTTTSKEMLALAIVLFVASTLTFIYCAFRALL